MTQGDGDGDVRAQGGRPDHPEPAPAWASPATPPGYVPVYAPVTQDLGTYDLGTYGPPTGQAWGAAPQDTRPLTQAAPFSRPAQPTQPVWQQPEPARRGRGRGSVVLVAALVALVVGLAGGFAGGLLADSARSRVVQDPGFSLPSPQGGSTQRASGTVPAVANGVLPSVVALQVSGGGEEGTGSGFVIDGGYILTNNHVVAAAADGDGDIRVVFQDGSQTKATIVGRDTSYDLAVVKADTGGRKPLPLGDSAGVVVGDSVIAIGAPLGLQGTVTTGIVSALNRPVVAGDQSATSFINAIQTDAAINPGNSGGPLVDERGRVIGINSAIARAPGSGAGQAGNIGLGFAIPSNQARRTAEELIRTGKSVHPIVGVLLDQEYAGEGVRVSAGPQNGQDAVTQGGPADRAGVRPGDVILAVDGVPVTAPEELIVQVRAKAVGEQVVLTIRRDGRRQELTVTLAASDG
jgi:putative serine protease PepD